MNQLARTRVVALGKSSATAISIPAVFWSRPCLSALQAAQDFVVICHSYPNDLGSYGGEYVRSRVSAYLQSGLSGTVIELNRRNRGATLERQGPVDVARMHPLYLRGVVETLRASNARILTHSPSPALQKLLQKRLEGSRIVHWFHGHEVRDPRRLYFNFSTAEMAEKQSRLDSTVDAQMSAARATFSSPTITKIFVSNFLKTIAERDMGAIALNAHVIPNFIDTDFYTAAQRSADQQKRILLLRSFHRRSYGNDIAIEALRRLSERHGFDALSITICGFGPLFRDTVAPLGGMKNVRIIERYNDAAQMAAAFAEHGIFLVPSRFDTQGVTMCEAMASGLACITNDVAGIPEFMDDTCGVLVPPDDPDAFAEALWDLAHSPERIASLGRNAAQRVRAQCSFDQTIAREIALISGDRRKAQG